MTSVNRRPLATRPQQSLVPTQSPLRHLKPVQLPKRPRSPDSAAHNLGSLIKRHKPTLNVPRKERDPELSRLKEQQRAEREQQRQEFKEKYCRAFPGWTFYLDGDSMDSGHQLESFRSRIQQLGAKIEPFFSRETTHLISNRPLPNQSGSSEKENTRTSSKPTCASKSPVKARTRQQDDQEATELIGNALKFKIKIWNATKLESVLSRCLEEHATATISHNTKQRNPHTLSKLLQSERIHGLSERDPMQKRHDFHYFNRGSHFVLIEDMHSELATIAAHEYPAVKKGDDEKPPWPTLYCHPCARGPFIPFDDREKKRWERLQQAEEKEREERRNHSETLLQRQLMAKQADSHLLERKAGDLRRSVSMNNMRNTSTHEAQLADHDGDGDAIESANASGYLASGIMGYMAASGNSVSITSTTGTTSTANYTSRNLQMPSNLSGRMRMEVIMRRQSQEKFARTNTMGPPVDVPQRSMGLKKSKSTNTLKLPKREEGSKPGYCESCRQKFEDFREHIRSRKHRKFAEDKGNFHSLDLILERVQRRTLAERQALNQRRFTVCRQISNQDSDCNADPISVED